MFSSELKPNKRDSQFASIEWHPGTGGACGALLHQLRFQARRVFPRLGSLCFYQHCLLGDENDSERRAEKEAMVEARIQIYAQLTYSSHAAHS